MHINTCRKKGYLFSGNVSPNQKSRISATFSPPYYAEKKGTFFVGAFLCAAVCVGPTYAVTCPAGYAAPDGASNADDCYMEIAPGYYWTGTAVKLCPAEHACAGGNMPYAEHNSEWGIVSCAGNNPTIYTGMAYCGCPIDPLDGQVGIYLTTGLKWCYKHATDSKYLGVNEYTTAGAACYWNGTNYGVGGINHYGCDGYRITACAAGYWAPDIYSKKNEPTYCIPVEPGYYSPDGATDRTACPDGLTTIGYGPGADEADDCGHALHVGDDTIYLRSTQKTTPSLKVKIGDDIFYGNASTENKSKLKVRKDGITYSIHDDSM